MMKFSSPMERPLWPNTVYSGLDPTRTWNVLRPWTRTWISYIIFIQCSVLFCVLGPQLFLLFSAEHRTEQNTTVLEHVYCVLPPLLYPMENIVTKFCRNSNFSDFLGIKSEISQNANNKTVLIKIVFYRKLKFIEKFVFSTPIRESWKKNPKVGKRSVILGKKIQVKFKKSLFGKWC